MLYPVTPHIIPCTDSPKICTSGHPLLTAPELRFRSFVTLKVLRGCGLSLDPRFCFERRLSCVTDASYIISWSVSLLVTSVLRSSIYNNLRESRDFINLVIFCYLGLLLTTSCCSRDIRIAAAFVFFQGIS